MESLSLYINEVATLLLAHETHISRKKALASLLASINLAKAAKPNFSPNSSMQAFSSDSASTNPQAYVSQGQSSLSSNFGSSYNNYNGGNRREKKYKEKVAYNGQWKDKHDNIN